jgi:uncharacterized membrane protein YjjB (DUF3815 family)
VMWPLAIYVLGAFLSAVAFAIALDVADSHPEERMAIGCLALIFGATWPLSVPAVFLAWLIARVAIALSRARP